jgi:FMN hydrolase / 5-amino-6-(5-phospho-D-ribitylamino)uracil phosphatase
MRTIEALLFDFGGTLDADGVRWSVRFHEAYRLEGGELPLPSFEDIFREVDRRMARAPGIRRMGLKAMATTQSAFLVEALPDGRRLSADRVAGRFHAESVEVARRNAELLGRLSARWPLAIISNFTGNLTLCLEELDLLHYFRLVLDSAVEGREKPDPELFLAARAALGSSAGATWMVGDNPEADIRPALALGMPACWLADPGREPPPGVWPTARIARLTELPHALEAACTV